MHRLGSKGFTAVEGIIIALVAATLVLATWWVWRAHSTDSTDNMSQGQTNTETEGKKIPGVDPSGDGKYLVINEWGVRFKLPQDMQGDVSYGIRKATPSTHEAASFEVGAIAKLPDSNCILREDSDGTGRTGGIGVLLIRSPETIPATEGPGNLVFTASDGHLYYVGSRGDGCVSGHLSDQLKSAQSLVNALKQLEELP